MRIGINLLFLLTGEVGGLVTYTESLIENLGKIDHTNEYFLFINKESAHLQFTDNPNFHIITCPIRARFRLVRFFWEQLILPWQAVFFRLDVMHSLGYISPLLLFCKSIVTIPDLNFYFIPEAFSNFTRKIQRFFVTRSAKYADQIIVISKFIGDQIVEYLKVPEKKIIVIHLAPKNRPLPNREDAWDDIKFHLSISKPYLLAFGSLSPHKNINRLIEAFAQIRLKGNDDVQLVIIGHLTSKGKLLKLLVEEMNLAGDDVIFTGYISDDWVSVLLSYAKLLVFPSLYEGFGMPILEAMRAGIPVACSSHGSLPEVARDAAIYFNPMKVNEMAEIISSIISDSALIRSLLEKGFLNLQRFSWEKTAQRTLDLYKGITIGD